MAKCLVDAMKPIEFGAGFDWITPLFSTFGVWFSGVEHFAMHEDFGIDVDYVLGQEGIKVCNGMYIDGVYYFDIRKGDVDRADSILMERVWG